MLVVLDLFFNNYARTFVLYKQNIPSVLSTLFMTIIKNKHAYYNMSNHALNRSEQIVITGNQLAILQLTAIPNNNKSF